MRLCVIVMLALLQSAGFGSAVLAEKFKLDGEILFYDTDSAPPGQDEINWQDVETLVFLLRQQHQIEVLHLNSAGGLIEAAREMADIIIDFKLDTRVTDECASACVTLFLAGESRQLDRGGRLGFHRSSWDAASMEEYYKDARADIGWDSLYEFASWSYEEAQKDVLSEMEYLLERGVDPEFAIKTLRAENADMWFPRRRELTLAGVLSKP